MERRVPRSSRWRLRAERSCPRCTGRDGEGQRVNGWLRKDEGPHFTFPTARRRRLLKGRGRGGPARLTLGYRPLSVEEGGGLGEKAEQHTWNAERRRRGNTDSAQGILDLIEHEAGKTSSSMELPMHEIRVSVIGKGRDLPQFIGDDGGVGPDFLSHGKSPGLGVRKSMRFLSGPSISGPSREAQKPAATVQPSAALAQGSGEGLWGVEDAEEGGGEPLFFSARSSPRY